ncbi:MAG: Gfo/Idh/MocA family oxidoreductase [Anaerolineales bacterium]|nr:Gfo/Idh/MocA family oxidoreductase [Anaerolineales bacterium]
MNRWRIGIIGSGWAGQKHGEALQKMPDRAEITAVADIDTALAEASAREWGAPFWSEDYIDLISNGGVDAVSICLPHDLHAPAAVSAALAGLHVLVEKPLANNIVEADAMITAAEAVGVQLMVAENVRFDATNQRVSEMLKEGVVGDIFLIRISREHQMHEYLRSRPWFLEQESAGIMVSGGIHDFELLRMLGGEIEHVYGLVAPKAIPEMKADDTSVALVQLVSGVSAVIVESFSIRTPEPHVKASVHGSDGSLWFYRDLIRIYKAPEDGMTEAVEEIKVSPQDTFLAEMEHFLDCLDSGAEPITSGREERKPLAAVQATYLSFKTGKRVYPADLESMDD